MKKLLLLAVVGLLAGAGIVLGIGALQSGAYRIERSIVIDAQPADVYAVFSDFRRYGEWSPWERLDPNLKKTVEGEPGTPGATYAWEGDDKVGAGRMTIVKAVPNEQIDVKIEFFRPFAAVSQSTWKVEAVDGQSKASWTMDGVNEGVMAKTFSMIFMERMLGNDFDTGLGRLKLASEKDAQQRGGPAPAP